jgi:hypothetical protein
MKSHKVLFLALLVSASLAVSVEAGDRHRNNNNRSGATSGSTRSYSSGSSFRSGNSRVIGSSQHFSSMGVRSMPSQRFAQRSDYSSGGNVAALSQRQFTPRTFNRTDRVARFESNRNFQTIQGTGGNRLSSLNNTDRTFNRTDAVNRFTRSGNNRNLGTLQGTGGNRFTNNNRAQTGQHVFARRSANWNRNWDRHSDHWWNGHRCRWVNNSWFIFDFGFVPWYGWSYYDPYPYDYYYPYSYGAYGYDPGVYDQSATYDQGGYNNYNDQSNYYDQGNSNSYNQGGLGSNERATVADVQDQLTRAGYYHGQIDGVLGPETRHALVRYQSDKGLRVTGSLTPETQQSLGLAQGGNQITDQ